MARRIFESLTVMDPHEPYYWLGFGVAAERCGDLESAERALHRAGRMDSSHPVPWVGLAEISLARGRRQEAREYLTRALERARDPRHAGLTEEIEARLRLLANAGRKVR